MGPSHPHYQRHIFRGEFSVDTSRHVIENDIHNDLHVDGSTAFDHLSKLLRLYADLRIRRMIPRIFNWNCTNP